MINVPELNLPQYNILQLSCSSNGTAWRKQRQDHGFDSQGKQELIKCKTVTWMQCKSLWIKASAKCINVNVIAQEDWLYQILNYIIGRSSLKLFIIGLILNLQFHGEWLKLTRLNQIDFKIFYLLAQEKKGIIINLVRLWPTLLKSGKRLNVG